MRASNKDAARHFLIHPVEFEKNKVVSYLTVDVKIMEFKYCN